jgi:hypothetical protein
MTTTTTKGRKREEHRKNHRKTEASFVKLVRRDD